MSDLELDRPYQRGDEGPQVKLIQEWLSLNGYHLKIDGEFGPATEAALRQFQTQQGLAVTGIADAATFERFVAPMKAALAPIAAQEIREKWRRVEDPSPAPRAGLLSTATCLAPDHA